METWTINGKVLEFVSDTHEYLCDGLIIPSVSQILHAFFDDYRQIPHGVLERAAERGTELHKAIEIYETTGKECELIEFKSYLFLKNYYKMENIANEIPVLYCRADGKPLFAGRIDQITRVKGKLGINDFKRVCSPNVNKVSTQLNLYRLAYEQSYGKEINSLSFMQLKDEKRKFFSVSIKEKETKDLINLYFKEY